MMRELVEKAQTGDTGAFARIVLRFQRRIYGYAFSRMRNHADAEESVQETFLRAFAKIDTLRDPGKLSPWLFTICRNCVLERLKAAQREELVAFEEQSWQEAEQTAEAEWEEYFDLLRMAINRLKPHLQKVLQLRCFTGLTYRGIAHLLDISQPLVKSRLYEAKRKVRELLPHLGEGLRLTLKQIKRETEAIMKDVELMKKGAYLFQRLSLYEQLQLSQAVEEARSFDDELLEAIGRVKGGAEFVEECRGRLTLHELVRILGRVGRETEFRFFAEMDERMPEFSESIKQNMMVFEDFVLADKAAIRKVIEGVDNRLIQRALVCCYPRAKQHFLDALTEEERDSWKADILDIVLNERPETEEAQEQILDAFHEMVKKNEVRVKRDETGIQLVG
jgi:RNA polymerase sigma-70 factor (ECF subfamily)